MHCNNNIFPFNSNESLENVGKRDVKKKNSNTIPTLINVLIKIATVFDIQLYHSSAILKFMKTNSSWHGVCIPPLNLSIINSMFLKYSVCYLEVPI